MAKKVTYFLSVLVMTLAFTSGCDSQNGTSSNGGNSIYSPSTNTPSSSSDVTSQEEAWPEGYTKDSGVGEANYYQTNSLEYPVQLKDLQIHEGTRCLDSYGTKKLLVIPVEFPDFPAYKLMNVTDDDSDENKAQAREDAKDFIETAFFGEAEDTGWESLKSFYYKSSYGQLEFEGIVTDWYMMKNPDDSEDMSVKELLDYWPTVTVGGNSGYNSTWYFLRKAVQWYKDNSAAKGWPDIKEFDQDGDGIIDGVWLVNSAGIKAYTSDDFWAFTYWDFNNPEVAENGGVYDVDNPTAVPYCSASFNFLIHGAYGNKADARTMIHETGHLMGLEDYYTYDQGSWAPCGGGDMMDNNVGDHSAFSKTLYGWTKPYVITGDAEITIKPFQENGDCIIVNNNWNGSAYDEYLMIEYYTPTNLNEKDSQELYKEGYPKLPTKKGLKIYHVDARLGLFDVAKYNTQGSKTKSFVKYVDEIYAEDTYEGKYVTTMLAHSNTSSRSANPGYTLLHLLESTGRNTFRTNGKQIGNTTIFGNGSFFGHNSKFVNYKFNDGSYLDYVIEVKSITDEGATIVFNAKSK